MDSLSTCTLSCVLGSQVLETRCAGEHVSVLTPNAVHLLLVLAAQEIPHRIRGNRSEGFPLTGYSVPGRDGVGVGQASRILPAPSLTSIKGFYDR